MVKYRDRSGMKDSGVEWLGMVPREWRRSSLRQVLKSPIVDGPHETPKYVDNGIPFISVDSINESESINLDIVNKFISEKEYNRYNKKTTLSKNDILFSKSATIGKVAIVDNRKYMTWSPLAIIKSDEKKVFYKLLYYILKSNGYLQHIISLSNLNTQLNIGMKVLEKSQIITSSNLQDQCTIANFLDLKTAQFDSIISKKEQLVKKLEEAKKSLVSEVVTGKVKIVDGKLVERKPAEMKDSGVEWLGMIPEGWNITTIRMLYDIKAGGDLNVTCYSEEQTETHKYPIYANKQNKEDVCGYTSIPRFCKNTITVTGRGDIGIAFYREHDYDAIIRLLVLSPKKKLMCKYHEYFINVVLFFNEGSSAIQQLSTQQIAPYKVYDIPYDIQIKIVKYLNNKVDKFDILITNINNQIQKLKQAKQSLISEAVTGKIDLRDWEIVE